MTGTSGLAPMAMRAPAAIAATRLDFTSWVSGSSVVISVAGEIDIATTGQLDDALGAALCRRPKGLIVDLTGVGFLGAAGLTTMLRARQHAMACRTRFDLVCPKRLPRRIIEIVGLDAVFSLHESVAEAAAAQAGAGAAQALDADMPNARCAPAGRQEARRESTLGPERASEGVQ